MGQILMTSAYRHAGAATIASFEYVSMIWGLTFGYLMFGEIPTAAVIVGGAIVIAAGIFIIFRERALGLERQRAPMPPSG
jgi:drug/metabolite transporter (DMT)-like permease